MVCWQGPQIVKQYGVKNKAAIALQCKTKTNVKFIPYCSLIWGDSRYINSKYEQKGWNIHV